MKRRAARSFLVIAVFALLAAVTAASHYLADTAHTPPPADQKPVWMVFAGSFRYYLAWALCAPIVFWLARQVPVIGRSRWRPAAFHLLLPAVAAAPFFTFRLLLNAAFTGTLPSLAKLATAWHWLLPAEILGLAPVYWLLLAAGTVLQVQREAEAREVRAVQLQRSLADAQLDGLRMKLQPHFLFNTLNAIGTLARQGDTESVARVVEHLGTLLRLSMDSSGRQFVTLEEELRLLDAYLAIEEVRHKDRLVVTRDIDPLAHAALVPSLILQPLVENAIAHGLGGRIDARSIEIHASRRDGGLEVAIRDDGPGLAPGWGIAKGPGRGLRNVVDRLAALYGRHAWLEVAPRPGGGTAASLHLPLSTAPAAVAGSAAWSA